MDVLPPCQLGLLGDLETRLDFLLKSYAKASCVRALDGCAHLNLVIRVVVL